MALTSPEKRPLLAVLLTALLLSISSCSPLATSPVHEYEVKINLPADGSRFVEGEPVQFAAVVTGYEAGEGEDQGVNAHDLAVVWTSDVAGVLRNSWGECAEDGGSDDVPRTSDEIAEGAPLERVNCWLSPPRQTQGDGSDGGVSALSWDLITHLDIGSHVVTASVVDLRGGSDYTSMSASIALDIEPLVAPEVLIYEPQPLASVSPGEDFDISAWIGNPIDRMSDVTLSSCVGGHLAETTMERSGFWTVPCHAGGRPIPGEVDCALPPGTHVLTLTATTTDGVTARDYLTVRVE